MPGTTPLYSFPYPLYTESTSLAAQIQSLAEAIDDQLETEQTTLAGAITRPSAKVQNLTNQSIPNSTLTTLTYTTEVIDNAAMVNLGVSNSTITAPVTGLYLVMGAAVFESVTPNNGAREMRLQLGVSSRAMSRYGATNTAVGNLFPTTVGCAMLVSAAAAQTFRIQVQQDSGGALNVTECFLAATRLA